MDYIQYLLSYYWVSSTVLGNENTNKKKKNQSHQGLREGSLCSGQSYGLWIQNILVMWHNLSVSRSLIWWKYIKYKWLPRVFMSDYSYHYIYFLSALFGFTAPSNLADCLPTWLPCLFHRAQAVNGNKPRLSLRAL